METKNEFDYSADIDEFINASRAKLITSRKDITWVELFDINFLAFERLVGFSKRSNKRTLSENKSAALKLKGILLTKGHISSLDDMKDATVLKYQSDARLRYEENRKLEISAINRTNVSKRYVKAIPSTDGAESTAMTEEVPGIELVETPSHQKDWLDSTWIGETPEWEKVRGIERPVDNEWTDHWENIWRHLYLKAEERGMNDFDKSNYAGFKKMGSDIGSLWLDLNKVRRHLEKEYGWKTAGVGKKD